MLKLERPIVCATGMTISFRYRTSAARLVVRLGKHEVTLETAQSGGPWKDVRVPLSAFMDDGVMMVPSDKVHEIRFEAPFKKKSGVLEVDQIEFLRRFP
jgi:hypothetical protein